MGRKTAVDGPIKRARLKKWRHTLRSMRHNLLSTHHFLLLLRWRHVGGHGAMPCSSQQKTAVFDGAIGDRDVIVAGPVGEAVRHPSQF
ncbi:hypothetical protein ACX40Y_00140 [Sphingomonas sp. RS6]